MPLSEDEQRILREIEEQLHRDPNFRVSFSGACGSRRSLFVSVGGGSSPSPSACCCSRSVLLAFAAFLGAMAAVICRAARACTRDEALRQVAALRRNASGDVAANPPTEASLDTQGRMVSSGLLIFFVGFGWRCARRCSRCRGVVVEAAWRCRRGGWRGRGGLGGGGRLWRGVVVVAAGSGLW